MLRCDTCSKELPLPAALLIQDLNANTVGFCSPSCQAAWYATTFSADIPLAAPISAKRTVSPARYFAAAS